MPESAIFGRYRHFDPRDANCRDLAVISLLTARIDAIRPEPGYPLVALHYFVDITDISGKCVVFPSIGAVCSIDTFPAHMVLCIHSNNVYVQSTVI